MHTSSVAGLTINRDLARYRKGYPGESFNNTALQKNLRFYRNEIQSVPDGAFIDELHEQVPSRVLCAQFYICWIGAHLTHAATVVRRLPQT